MITLCVVFTKIHTINAALRTEQFDIRIVFLRRQPATISYHFIIRLKIVNSFNNRTYCICSWQPTNKDWTPAVNSGNGP